MKGLDSALKELEKMAQNQRDALEEARKAQEEANRLREAAEEKERKATEAQAKIETARSATEDARRAVNDIDSTNGTNPNKKNNAKKILTAAGAIVLIGALSIGGYILIKEARSGKIKDSKDSNKSMSDTLLEDTSNSNNYDADSNILTVEDNYEPLTTENFESLVSDYAKKYSEQYDGVVTTKDITKFASIANIDLLSEENSELANELFSGQTKEEYLNDAAKIIGTTVMYNFNIWNNSLSTKDFIKISDIVYGEQKEQMIKIEEYTDRIASAVIKDDADLVNNIVSEFLTDLNSGSLSKLDDGVGFAAQVNIAIIADGIARNHLNKENFDMFQVLKTAEKYVSNIFTEYDNCANSNTKTLTK